MTSASHIPPAQATHDTGERFIAVCLSSRGDAEWDRLSGAWNPVQIVLIAHLVEASLKAAGVNATVGAVGAPADGLMRVTVDARMLAVSLATTKEALAKCCFGSVVEIAHFDAREEIWRHYQPDNPAGPFERLLSDEATKRRQLLFQVFMQEAQRIQSEGTFSQPGT